MPKPIARPEKELRFTRSRQAVTFCAIGVIFTCFALALGLLAWPAFVPREEPLVSPPWLGLVPIVPAVAAFWFAGFLARHAFLLLSPVGVEIFPLWRPARNFRLVLWQEIEYLAVDEACRWLEVALAGGGRVFVSLAPLAIPQRQLLARAAAGTMERREEMESGGGRDS